MNIIETLMLFEEKNAWRYLDFRVFRKLTKFKICDTIIDITIP